MMQVVLLASVGQTILLAGVGLIVLLAVGAFSVYMSIRNRVIQHRPANSPNPAKRQADKTVVVCAGDSITHGVISANYVDQLERELPASDYQLFNAGINADLSYTLLRRLDAVIAVNPGVVTILIGTNDINATISADSAKLYRKLERILPGDAPSFETYQKNYRTIVRRLKAETTARIALISLPVMSEDLNETANQLADQYSTFVNQLAHSENVTYLPLREQMKTWLNKHPKTIRYAYADHYKMMNVAVLKHQLLGRSWDQLTADVGQDFTYDQLHLNSRGAAMIAQLVKGFVMANQSHTV